MKFLYALIAIAGLFIGGYFFYTNLVQNGEDSGGIIGNNLATALDLSGKGLTKIPEYVFNRTSLEKLDVSDNKITGAIQGEIRFLENLKELDLSNNLMTGVPAEIGRLPKLEILDLSDNKLTGLPNELGNLSNLKTLDISGNDYSELDLATILEKLPDSVEVIK